MMNDSLLKIMQRTIGYIFSSSKMTGKSVRIGEKNGKNSEKKEKRNEIIMFYHSVSLASRRINQPISLLGLINNILFLLGFYSFFFKVGGEEMVFYSHIRVELTVLVKGEEKKIFLFSMLLVKLRFLQLCSPEEEEEKKDY